MTAQRHNKENDSYGAIAFANGENGPAVLMVRAKEGWSFPKGHFEKGESPAQCAERETFEETDIRVKVTTAFVSRSPDAKGDPDRSVYFFIAESEEGVKQPKAKEISEAEWVPVEEAEARILFAPDREAYRKARAFLRSRQNAPEPKHLLICAKKQTGKSTIIQRLINEVHCPVYGYITKLGEADGEGFHPIHIHAAKTPEAERVYTEENLAGLCNSVRHNVFPRAFDVFGARAIAEAQPGGIIVMDELGFMEKNAETFKSTVRAALTGDIPVIAAVKSRYDVEFLNELRAMPTVRLIDLTEENRDALFEELLPVVKQMAGE